jgi:hypothetical protein
MPYAPSNAEVQRIHDDPTTRVTLIGKPAIKIVCLSDTHDVFGFHNSIPAVGHAKPGKIRNPEK